MRSYLRCAFYHIDPSHTVYQRRQLLLARQVEESFTCCKEGRIEKVDAFLIDTLIHIVYLFIDIDFSVGIGQLQIPQHKPERVELTRRNDIVKSANVYPLVADDYESHIRDLKLFSAAALRIRGEAVGIKGPALLPIGGRGSVQVCAGR